MSEADAPRAIMIAIFGIALGLIWGYRMARKRNANVINTDPATTDQLGEELARTRGEYKDYRDDVDGEFGNINASIRKLNLAYAALLNTFVEDAEKLCPDNKDALKLAANDRDLIAIGPMSSSEEQKANS